MKARLIAVLVISLLIVLLVATAVYAKDNSGPNVQYVDCSQVQNAVGGQYGAATAIGRDATAEVAQELNISQDQVNACLGQLEDDNNNNPNRKDDSSSEDKDAEEGDTKADVIDDTIPKVASLPNTGGPSLPALGVGVALVAAGASLIGFGVRR